MKMRKNEQGFTLVEIMVSCMIMLLTIQLFFTGISITRKMEQRAEEISVIYETLEDRLADKTLNIEGKLSLKLGSDVEITGVGYLHRCGEEKGTLSSIEIIWMEETK